MNLEIIKADIKLAKQNISIMKLKKNMKKQYRIRGRIIMKTNLINSQISQSIQRSSQRWSICRGNLRSNT